MVDFSDKQLDAEDMLPENWRTSMNHSDELYHFGVKGMKWGIRKKRNKPSKAQLNKLNADYTSRQRIKDQASYGKKGVERINRHMNKGRSHFQASTTEMISRAGVRRRNINSVVRQRSKDPIYKKAFDEEYSKQDMGKARRDAERQRKRTDRTEPVKTGISRGAKKAVRAGTKAVTTAATTAAATATAYYISHPDEAKRMVNTIAKKASSTVNRVRNVARGAQFLRKMGL